MGLLKTYNISTDVDEGEVSPVELSNEILDSGYITNFNGLIITEDNLEVLGDSFINESGVDSIVSGHEIAVVTELVNSTLSDYKELNITFDGLIKNSWHEIELDSSIDPNSIIVVSCRNKDKKERGWGTSSWFYYK